MIWPPGLPGPQGAAGAQGSAGAQGPQGLTGAVGAQGAAGAQGAIGLQGLQGAQGTTGAQGATGTQGTSGVILQVIEANTSTATTVASATYTDIGVSASITPTSTSNKVLVTVSIPFSFSRAGNRQGVGIKILRGSTEIYASVQNTIEGPIGTGLSIGGSTSVSQYDVISVTFIDSPATTSSTTYKVQGACTSASSSGTSTFTPSGTAKNSTSYIVLQEVSA